VAEDESKSLHIEWPNSSSIFAITTLAPCLEKSLATHSPIPLAPPVIDATFLSSLFFQNCISQITIYELMLNNYFEKKIKINQ